MEQKTKQNKTKAPQRTVFSDFDQLNRTIECFRTFHDVNFNFHKGPGFHCQHLSFTLELSIYSIPFNLNNTLSLIPLSKILEMWPWKRTLNDIKSLKHLTCAFFLLQVIRKLFYFMHAIMFFVLLVFVFQMKMHDSPQICVLQYILTHCSLLIRAWFVCAPPNCGADCLWYVCMQLCITGRKSYANNQNWTTTATITTERKKQ